MVPLLYVLATYPNSSLQHQGHHPHERAAGTDNQNQLYIQMQRPMSQWPTHNGGQKRLKLAFDCCPAGDAAVVPEFTKVGGARHQTGAGGVDHGLSVPTAGGALSVSGRVAYSHPSSPGGGHEEGHQWRGRQLQCLCQASHHWQGANTCKSKSLATLRVPAVATIGCL